MSKKSKKKLKKLSSRSKLVALVDMDGTICDYDGAIIRDMAKVAGPDDPPYELHGTNLEYIRAREDFIRRTPGWWRNLEPKKDSIKFVQYLEWLGFTVHILTKGPSSKSLAWAEKVEWVRHYLPHVNITVTEDKSLVYGKILFDDYWPYCEGWLEHRPRGLVVMPKTKGNAHIDHPQVMHFDGSVSDELCMRIRGLIG